MVDAALSGKTVAVNDTATYNNGVKVVPSYLLSRWWSIRPTGRKS